MNTIEELFLIIVGWVLLAGFVAGAIVAAIVWAIW
jgi:hypothetical protein